MLDWNDTLGRQLLDLLLTVLLPVLNIWVDSDSHWSSSEDNRPDVIVVSSCANSVLVSLWSASLISQDESGTNPNSRSTQHESGSHSLAIVYSTGRNNLHWLAGHWAGLPLAEFHDLRNEDCGGNVSCVSTSLATLSADDVDTEIEALLDMLDMSNHVRIEDTGFVEALDDMFWGHANGRDEEFGTALDGDGNELIEFALGVIVAVINLSAIDLRLGTWAGM